jgi:hypothetical protein
MHQVSKSFSAPYNTPGKNGLYKEYPMKHMPNFMG